MLVGKGSNSDLALAWDNAVASPLDVDASVAFLYNDRLAAGEDRAELKNEYKQTVGSAYAAAACGAIDDVLLRLKQEQRLYPHLICLQASVKAQLRESIRLNNK